MKLKKFLNEKINKQIILNVSKKYYCDKEGVCDYLAEDLTKELLKNGVDDFKIIEGWIISGDIPISHTWIELKDGEIIDPSKKQFKNGIDEYKKNKFNWYYEDTGIEKWFNPKVYTPKEYLEFAKLYPSNGYKKNIFLKEEYINEKIFKSAFDKHSPRELEIIRLGIENLKQNFDGTFNYKGEKHTLKEIKVMKEYGFEKIIKNPDGTYNVWGDFYENPNKIPFKIKNFYGNFRCYFQGIKELKNIPEKVNGNFNINLNPITSLKGCPKVVVGNFYCEETDITTLDYLPKSIGGSIFLSSNKITSLKGCPKIVNGTFACSENKLKNLQYCPEIIKGDFKCAYNKLSTLKYFPKKVGGNVLISKNKINFWKHDIEKICDVGNEVLAV